MCVAVPGRIEWIGEGTASAVPARINTGDHTHEIDLIMVTEARVGDYVVAHSGYAIRLVAPSEATATRRILGIDA